MWKAHGVLVDFPFGPTCHELNQHSDGKIVQLQWTSTSNPGNQNIQEKPSVGKKHAFFWPYSVENGSTCADLEEHGCCLFVSHFWRECARTTGENRAIASFCWWVWTDAGSSPSGRKNNNERWSVWPSQSPTRRHLPSIIGGSFRHLKSMTINQPFFGKIKEMLGIKPATSIPFGATPLVLWSRNFHSNGLSPDKLYAAAKKPPSTSWSFTWVAQLLWKIGTSSAVCFKIIISTPWNL